MRTVLGIAMLMLLAVGCSTTQTSQDRPGVPAERWPDQAWEQAANQQLPPGVARVTIERYEVDERDRSAIEAVVKYRDENISVSAGHLGGRNGVVIYGAKSGLSGELRVSRDSQYSRRSSSQFLLLNEGTTGSLSVLESRPQPWAVVIPIYRGALIVNTIAEQITGSGMVVGVHQIHPEAVVVQLMPYFHRRMGREVLHIEELATTVTLRPGVPYVIMSNQSHEQSVATALFARRTTEQHRQVVTILRVDVGQ